MDLNYSYWVHDSFFYSLRLWLVLSPYSLVSYAILFKLVDTNGVGSVIDSNYYGNKYNHRVVVTSQHIALNQPLV